MPIQQEKNFSISVKLTMLDYFRYYFSLFNLKLSGRIVNILSVLIITVYSLSLFSLIYISYSTGSIDWKTGRGILLDLLIIFMFSIPFIRTYLIAYKDAKSHKFLDKPIDIVITEDKFIAPGEDSKVEYSWKKMYRIIEFYHGFALFINKKDLTFVIPKRCFMNKEQIKVFRDIIKKYNK